MMYKAIIKTEKINGENGYDISVDFGHVVIIMDNHTGVSYSQSIQDALNLEQILDTEASLKMMEKNKR